MIHLMCDLHAFFSYPFNNMTSHALMNMLFHPLANLNPNMVLNLNFQVEEALELPMVWLTTNIVMKMWDFRKEKKRCDLVLVRTELEARVSLLKESRFREASVSISHMLLNLS